MTKSGHEWGIQLAAELRAKLAVRPVELSRDEQDTCHRLDQQDTCQEPPHSHSRTLHTPAKLHCHISGMHSLIKAINCRSNILTNRKINVVKVSFTGGLKTD